MSKEPTTAEQYLRISAKSYGYEHLGQFSPEEMAQCMIEFAKQHRKEMIEAIKANAECNPHEKDIYDWRVCPDSIENAYRESEIK